MYRFLSVDDEPRRPSERAALMQWRAQRPHVQLQAVHLDSVQVPDEMTQIENLDRIMLEVFNSCVHDEEYTDIETLTAKTLRIIKNTWVPTRLRTPVHMAGSQAIPEYDSYTRRNLHQLEYLR